MVSSLRSASKVPLASSELLGSKVIYILKLGILPGGSIAGSGTVLGRLLVFTAVSALEACLPLVCLLPF